MTRFRIISRTSNCVRAVPEGIRTLMREYQCAPGYWELVKNWAFRLAGGMCRDLGPVFEHSYTLKNSATVILNGQLLLVKVRN